MKAVIFLNPRKKNAVVCSLEAVGILETCGIEAAIDAAFAKRLAPGVRLEVPERLLCEETGDFDFAISVGGDGTLLKTAKLLLGRNIPLLGINTGRLGFMCSLEAEELSMLRRLPSADYHTCSRMLIQCSVTHADGTVSDNHTALNDIVIARSFSRLCDFRITADGSVVSEYRADGLIFSTPTGSTAYALSSGGAIISPDVDCIELVPICPHTLFSRPMLFSSDTCLDVRPDYSRADDLCIYADGGAPVPLKDGDVMNISVSPFRTVIIDMKRDTFYAAVNTKLVRPIKP